MHYLTLQSGAETQPSTYALTLLSQFSGQALRVAPTPALGCCSTAPATSLLITGVQAHRTLMDSVVESM